MSGERSASIRPMIYRTYTPQPPLAAFVEAFWLYVGNVWYISTHIEDVQL
ncbi:MAG: hypothetical protein ACRDIV_03350 [Ktedonobacteraceae bacterium]